MCVTETKKHKAASGFTICGLYLYMAVQVFRRSSRSIGEFDNFQNRGAIVRRGTGRSTHCSTSSTIQSLEKSSVASSNKTSFIEIPTPLHCIHCLLFCVLTLRECLLTTVNRTKAEDDPELGQHRLDRLLGGPGGRRCGSMTGKKKEQNGAAKSTGVIIDSHIRSIKV